MKFGPVPLAGAEGAILAHAHHLPGRILRKGVTLGPEELEALRDAGVDEVVVARLEDDDVGENDAARAVASASAGPFVTVGRPGTGRCNLTASTDGLVRLDAARVEAVNTVHEGMTLACLAPFHRVVRGELVGTVKVIPFAVPRAVVTECSRIAAQGPLLDVAPFRRRRSALILTRLPGTRDEASSRAAEVLAARLAARGSTLDFVRTVEHRCEEVSRAVGDALAGGWSPVFVLGASAIVDRADVIPAAVEAAGGVVERFGIPVDPGNLLMLARHGDVPIVGMPGCARSPRESGFDRVLDMLLADVPVDGAGLAGWGIGGLMKEILSRRQPREGVPPPMRRPPDRRVGTVVLAAGASRRMQGANKLIEEVDGIPMVARVVDAARAAGTLPVVLVTGHDHAAVEAALAGRPVRWVPNPRWAEGMGTSIAAGLAALEGEVEGALICLGDMPRVSEQDLRALVRAFEADDAGAAWIPVHEGKRGNPVLWSARCFARLRQLTGDHGGRALLDELADEVVTVPVPGSGILVDADTREELDHLRTGASEPGGGGADGLAPTPTVQY